MYKLLFWLAEEISYLHLAKGPQSKFGRYIDANSTEADSVSEDEQSAWRIASHDASGLKCAIIKRS
jgi:hypothetical protein